MYSVPLKIWKAKNWKSVIGCTILISIWHVVWAYLLSNERPAE